MLSKSPAAAKSAKKPAAKTAAVKTPAAKPAAKAASAKAPASKSATITLSHLAKVVAETHTLPKKQAATILTEVMDMIAKHLKKGAKVRINGIGVLQVKKRAARIGRNPATGEKIKIKASKKVAFRAAKELKEAI